MESERPNISLCYTLSPSPILALHAQRPGHIPSWQQEPFTGQWPRQDSSRSAGQAGLAGRGQPWRSSGREYSDWRTERRLEVWLLPVISSLHAGRRVNTH